MRKIALLISVVKDIFSRFHKIRFDQIYFVNIWGKYNDNTKALAEKYHELFPEYKLFYEIKSKQENLPEYVVPVLKGSKESRKIKYSSSVVIDNDWGAIKKEGKGIIGRLYVFLYRLSIPKKTIFVSTFHGTPIKKIGIDRPGTYYNFFTSSTQYMAVMDRHLEQVTRKSTLNKISNYLYYGSPRNDCLFRKNEYIREMKTKLGLGEKKVALFAPTFRTIVSLDGKNEFVNEELYLNEIISKSKEIIEALSNRFGGEWELGIRTHPGVSKIYSSTNEGNVFFADKSDDMADYLMVCDFLFTDYSSSCFDYMLTRKPIILLWYDYDHYRDEERGLYFDDESIPFPVAFSMENLIRIINCFDYETFLKRIQLFEKKYNFYQEQDSSKKIIIDIEREKKHESN